MIWHNDGLTLTLFIMALLCMQALAIILGYWMGRQVVEKPFSNEPKQFDPGPAGVDIDPYEEALKPDDGGKRIETIV